MIEQELNGELPEGWAHTRLADITTPSKERIEPSECPGARYLSLEHISAHAASIAGFGMAIEVNSTKTVFHQGDVLYGKLRPYLNKVCIPDFDGVCSTDILVFPQADHVESSFLIRYLMRDQVVDYAHHHSSGVQLPRVGWNDLAQLEVPFPPLAEQRRIGKKIDALFSRVNAARTRLARVSGIIKRFRQSVLSAACSGRLTADWREEHPEIEPASVLLKRIRAERKTALGKKYRESEPADVDGLPELPERWCWSLLPEMGEMNRGRSRHRPRNAAHLYGGSYPFIQTGDIAQSGGKIIGHRQTYSEAGLAQSRLWPADTICITIAANIADSAVLTYDACFPDSVVGVICDTQLCLPQYLQYFIRTARADLSAFAPATAQKNINIAILNELVVPLPSVAEQREIVRRVDALFALADTIETRVSLASTRADKLTQAILAKAFRGELVPTEAELARAEGRDYEPASMLLERVLKERELPNSSTNPRKHRKPR